MARTASRRNTPPKADRRIGRGAPRLAVGLFAVALLTHVAMFVSLFVGYLNPLFNDADGGHTQGIDFFAIYRAGTYLLHGRSIYSVQEVFIPYGSSPYASPYRYVPFVAETAGVALNSLSAWNAYWLWVALIEVMLAVNIWLTLRLTRHRVWALVAASMWLIYTPLYVEEYMGQWSFFMATLMFWTVLYLDAGRPHAALPPWALSLTVKSNSALLAPLFIRLRQWRPVLMILTIVIALNAPYFAFFPGDARTFWHLNFGQYIGREPIRREALLSGDYGFIALIQNAWLVRSPNVVDVPDAVVTGFAGLVLAVSLGATLIPRRVDVVAMFTTWCAVFFLLYLAWEHHYVMLLPALVLLVAVRPRYRFLSLMVFTLLAVPTTHFVFSRVFDAPVGGGRHPNQHVEWPLWASVLEHSTKAVPTFALWLVTCWSQLSRSESDIERAFWRRD